MQQDARETEMSSDVMVFEANLEIWIILGIFFFGQPSQNDSSYILEPLEWP